MSPTAAAEWQPRTLVATRRRDPGDRGGGSVARDVHARRLACAVRTDLARVARATGAGVVEPRQHLWDAVVASSSLPDLAARLATFGIDRLPSLAAFFWTAEGMRSLVRGDVSVVDLASGDVVARGEGIQTWTEIGLGDVRQVRVDTPLSGDQTLLALPLVVGAARVSSVTLDATEEAVVLSPQGQPADATEGLAATEAFPELAPEPTERDDRAAGRHAVGVLGRRTGRSGSAEPAQPDQAEPEPLGDEPTNRVRDDARLPPMPPGFDAEALARLENADTALMPTPPPPVPAGLPAATAAFAEVESPGPPSSPASEISQDSLIMAVVCQYGHASPQNATICRICGSPIAPQGPRLIPRPVLAVLRASDGATADGGPRRADRPRPLEPSVQCPGAAADDRAEPWPRHQPNPPRGRSRRLADRGDRPQLHQRDGAGPTRWRRPATAHIRGAGARPVG